VSPIFIDVQPEAVMEAKSATLMAVLFRKVIPYSTVRFFNGIPQVKETGYWPGFLLFITIVAIPGTTAR
jgi:hypothetical protein